ncbi:hypothetical protein HYZ76_02540 [Candidatus Falkowbacteria bacterium]|nr:hypothetical protein [Candidatus Falkowbacteria bacterium]
MSAAIFIIITINLFWALSIGFIHFNKKFWRLWEDMTTKRPGSHYLIGGFNFFIVIANLFLWYLVSSK